MTPSASNKKPLREMILRFTARHGSLRAAARVLNCNSGYLLRLRDGEKDNPSNKLLRKLGLKKKTTYERIE